LPSGQKLDLRRRHHDVPWRQVVGLRNIVAHDYFAVYLPKIWEIVQESLPPLRQAVAHLRDELGGQRGRTGGDPRSPENPAS